MVSKRHTLQAMELSRRLQTAVKIVSKPPAPSNGGPDLQPCGPAGLLVLLLIKADDVEINPGPTTTHKQGFAISAINKYTVGSSYRYGAKGLNTGYI